ncbi:hypothetical protein Golob_022581 [Gossypium lobatum]|uniref:Uncharacterized protein n=1 Tax=Gossypium lobatum TaxID=34289 RepID=A0A7J8LH42_9ROSI|nr:hypothetical protein [Gossypium lobatum]
MAETLAKAGMSRKNFFKAARRFAAEAEWMMLGWSAVFCSRVQRGSLLLKLFLSAK